MFLLLVLVLKSAIYFIYAIYIQQRWCWDNDDNDADNHDNVNGDNDDVTNHDDDDVNDDDDDIFF